MVAGAVAEGIEFLDHTADLGMDVRSPSLHGLLDRAAVGMLMLLRGEEDDHATPDGRAVHQRNADQVNRTGQVVTVDLAARDAPQLMASWLREILFLHEVRGLDYEALEEQALTPTRLVGRIRTCAGGHAVREIKGVTYHALEVSEEHADGWHARVIFDV